MATRKDGLNDCLLERTEILPAEAVDDVVLQGRVKAVERRHGSNSMSSTSLAAVAFRSTAVSSFSETVRA